MDIRMPDGTVIKNVPENITKSELLARYEKTQQQVPQAKEPGLFSAKFPGLEQLRAGFASTWGQPRQPVSPEQAEIMGRMEQDIPTTLTELPGESGAGRTMGELAVENAPAIGATVGSVLAPQIGVPAAVARFGPAAAKLLGPIVSNAPRVLAAGAGGAAGGAGREAIANPEASMGDIAGAALESGREMAAAEAGGIMAIGALNKILSPGVKTITEEGKKLLKFAKANKLPLKPSAVAPSWTAKTAEATADAFLPSRVVKQFQNKKIANVLTTSTPEANNLIAKVTQVHGASSPGMDKTIRSSTKAIKLGLEKWQPKVEAKYDTFLKAIGGKERWTDYPKLREAMDAIKSTEGALTAGADDVTTKFIDAFQGKYSGQISADDLYNQYKRLGHIKGADKRNLGLLRDAFKAEFDDLAKATGDDAAKLLNEANKEYILGKKYFKNNRIVNQIAKGELPDNQVTVRLFRDGEYGTLKQLEANIPKEHFEDLLRLNLENMVQNSSAPGANPFVQILDGNKLLKWIDRNPKTIGLYPKETQEALRNLALYAKYHAPEALSGTKDFVSAMTSAAAKTGAVGGALKYMGADMSGGGVIVSSAAAPALAWDLMRPGGWTRAWLTGTRQLGPAAQEGLKVGGRLVFQDSLNGPD